MKLQDLKRGMKIVFNNSYIESDIVDYINEKGYLYSMDGGFYTAFDENLINFGEEGFTIVEVFDLDCNGEYYLIWKRKEEKYVLQCPMTNRDLYKYDLNEFEWGYSGTKFTQEEIDKFPNQDFIQSLEKEKVLC